MAYALYGRVVLRAMRRLALVYFALFSISCQTGSNGDDKSAVASSYSQAMAIDNSKLTKSLNADTIILYEDRIKGIGLPFDKRDMLEDLKEQFDGYTIVREMGQQDGPDFPLYTMSDKGQAVCFFELDFEDTLKLNRIVVRKPIIKDQYGIKVGDNFQKIKKLREGDIKLYTNYHQHTYASLDSSRIKYQIDGYISLPDSVDIVDLKLTDDQVKDWIVEYIIWEN